MATAYVLQHDSRHWQNQPPPRRRHVDLGPTLWDLDDNDDDHYHDDYVNASIDNDETVLVRQGGCVATASNIFNNMPMPAAHGENEYNELMELVLL